MIGISIRPLIGIPIFISPVWRDRPPKQTDNKYYYKHNNKRHSQGNSMSEIKSAANTVELDATQLPAYCPHTTMPLWSSHPRVYLDLAHNPEAKCPYCGTVYRLTPGSVVQAH
jgi:uncharacterized Zn-finger protein